MNNTMPDWGQNDSLVLDQKQVAKNKIDTPIPISFNGISSDLDSFVQFKQNMDKLLSFFTNNNLPSIGGFDLDDAYSQKGKIPFPKQKDLPYDEVVGGKETTPITYLCDKYGINPLNVTSIKVTDHETDQNLKVITIEKLVF